MNLTEGRNLTYENDVNFFDVHSPGKVVYGIFLAIASVLATSFTLTVLKRSKEIGHEDDSVFMLFQMNSICNMICGLSMAGLSVTYDTDGTVEPYWTPVWCQTFKSFVYVTNFQANATVTAITLNRYQMIRWPLQYNSHVSFRRMRAAVITILTVSALYLMYLPIPGFPFSEGLVANCLSPVYYMPSQVIISTFMTIVWFSNLPTVALFNGLLVKSALRARRSRRVTVAKVFQPRHELAASCADLGNAARVKRRGIKIVVSISVAYLICNTPTAVLLTLNSLQIIPFTLETFLVIFSIWISCSIWNLIAFMLFDTKFRRIVCDMCSGSCAGTSRQT